MSPAFSQSPFATQPVDGALLSLLSTASGAVVFAVAIPLLRRRPSLLEGRRRAAAFATLASLSTLGIAFGSLFGSASAAAFVVCGIVSGIGISVLYLQWGTYYATIEPRHVAPCTLVSFLCALVLAGLSLDHGIATSLLAALLPLAAAFALPRNPTEAPSRPQPVRNNAPKPSASLKATIPLRVLALIMVFCFTFGLFRILLPLGGSGGQNMGLVLGCSALLAVAMLALVSFLSVTLGWDFIVYLALPLIAFSALVLSVVDFADRAFVWAIIVAAVRCADLIMWMIFARLSRSSEEPPAVIFAFGKLAAQTGVLLGLLVGTNVIRTLDVESLLLPIALALTLLVTLLGSLTAIQVNMAAAARGRSQTAAAYEDGQERVLELIARDCSLSPRETEIFALLAKGRTIPYIADELVLAKSTIATHARSIYRKMGIHNRQELIDYVEERRGSPESDC